MKNRIIYYLRWILVLPAVVLTFFITSLIISVILWMVNSFSWDLAIIDTIFQDVLKNGAIGYYSLLVSAIVAPKSKKITALIILIIICMLLAINIFLAIYYTDDYISIIGSISLIVGATFSYYKLNEMSEEELEYFTNL
ncbi:hypothetical protein [Winogradskyella sp. A2]|uniref:hypothetical protein n=1 Tax=Winogradskyella sp. A2 TaxID=3366944 RepID=UPI00398C372E